jgi:hypothetical protein
MLRARSTPIEVDRFATKKTRRPLQKGRLKRATKGDALAIPRKVALSRETVKSLGLRPDSD